MFEPYESVDLVIARQNKEGETKSLQLWSECENNLKILSLLLRKNGFHLAQRFAPMPGAYWEHSGAFSKLACECSATAKGPSLTGRTLRSVDTSKADAEFHPLCCWPGLDRISQSH